MSFNRSMPGFNAPFAGFTMPGPFEDMIPAGGNFDLLVLAGGLGTRLRSVVASVPKPMAPVNGRPFLCWLLDHWTAQGANRILLSVGHLSGVIEDFFGSQYRGVSVEYLHDPAPVGTGGAIKRAIDSAAPGSNQWIVVNGDTWFQVSAAGLMAAARPDCLVTMAVKPVAANDRYGLVRLDGDGRVMQFLPHSHEAGFINSGCYLFHWQTLRAALSSFPQAFSFEQQFLTQIAERGLIAAHVQDGPFVDIGVPYDYARSSAVLKEMQHVL